MAIPRVPAEVLTPGTALYYTYGSKFYVIARCVLGRADSVPECALAAIPAEVCDDRGGSIARRNRSLRSHAVDIAMDIAAARGRRGARRSRAMGSRCARCARHGHLPPLLLYPLTLLRLCLARHHEPDGSPWRLPPSDVRPAMPGTAVCPAANRSTPHPRRTSSCPRCIAPVHCAYPLVHDAGRGSFQASLQASLQARIRQLHAWPVQTR